MTVLLYSIKKATGDVFKFNNKLILYLLSFSFLSLFFIKNKAARQPANFMTHLSLEKTDLFKVVI